MVITDIYVIHGSKSRYRIFIDEEFAFVLYKGELRLYDISIGNELSTESYQEIIENILPKRAKMRALNLLKNRRYTEKQLRDRLSRGEYSVEIINDTIEYLKSYRYLDDLQYAKDYIEYHLSTKSRNRICQDLLRKGIANEITDVIYIQIAGESTEELENTQILMWLEKKKFEKSTADLKEKQRIFAFLFRKGFSVESIKRFLL